MSRDNLPEKISPEGVKIANTYLQASMSLDDTARALNMEKHEVSEVLNSKYVKVYINSIMSEAGFRQIDNIESILNTIIDQKLEELREADITSSKDIADLLALAHKISSEKLKLIQAREDKENGVINQKNTQFNIYDSNSSYGKLMEAIASGKDI